MENVLKYNLTHVDAKFEPKHNDNAGYDLYAINDEFDSIVLDPGEIRKVKTGLRLAIPQGYWGEIKERSSTGSKGLAVRAGVVDCNYRGEVIICLNNTSDKTIIHPITKAVAQIIIQKYESLPVKAMSKDNFEELTTERGDKGFGSTDKQ